ncbi:MAG TPA: DUF445 family protein [Candidatus Blautia stercoripullorum]|uniref:DUF445 family protein n=1 Tax=Candidatus Blautia stercoripullorum TaxID=2838502 RepID=A0A9D2RAM5_9FIRM|nr:DUF445 family protein [Candidatus Blautia stercoripullorum]
MNLIEILGGPLIGAVIGYFTNYIAVKMLFHPLKPVKIGGKVLPFTPGIIPKGKPRLAKALGKAVGEKLFTHEDLKAMLLSREIKESVLDSAVKGIQEVQNSQDSLETFMEQYIDTEDYEHMRGQLEKLLTEKITQGLEKLDVGRIIAEEGAKEVKEKFQGSMVSMFLKDDLIKSIAAPIGDKVGEYIKENGRDKIRPLVVGEIAAAESRPICQWFEHIPLGEEKIRQLADRLYTRIAEEKAGDLAEKFQIAQVVEEKVNCMDVAEVEEILLGVMKKELNAVVNLGALIGFVIGLLNLLF